MFRGTRGRAGARAGTGRRWLCCALLLIALFLHGPPALAETNSQDGEFTAFDLVVGGVVYGQVYGYYAGDWFAPDNASDAVALLPAVKTPADFLPMFEGRIERVRTIRGVGVMQVNTVNFQLMLEVDREQSILAPVAGIERLEGSEKELAVRNNLFLAGSADTQSFDFASGASVSHDTVISKESLSAQSTGTMTGDNGYVLRNALVRKDFRVKEADMTAFGGLLETASGMRFARSLSYTGLRLGSNEELLFRDPQLQGSGLEIFLPRRAQVQVYRDSEASGQVLYSRILDFGTVQIDTRAFPAGSYDIEVVARDAGAVVFRESRPFLKTQKLAPRGKPLLTLEGGELRDGVDMQGVMVAHGAARARVLDWLGAGASVMATSDDSVYEATIQTQHGLEIFRAAGLLETSLTGAFAGAMQPAGMSADLLWSSRSAAFALGASRNYARANVLGLPGSLALSDREAANFSFSMPLAIGDYIIYSSFNAEVSDSSASGPQHHYGPSFAYKFENFQGYLPELKVEYTMTESGSRALATLSLRSEDTLWQKYGSLQASRISPDSRMAAQAGISYAGRNAEEEDWRRRLDASLGLRADPLFDSTGADTVTTVSGEAQYSGKFVRVKSYVEEAVSPVLQGQIGGEAESTLLWTPKGGLTATSETSGADMALVVVRLEGAKGTKIDVTLNGIARGAGEAGDTVVLPVPVYEQVRIGATDRGGKGTFKIKEKTHTIVSYPGNVAYRTFTVVKSWILMGVLTDAAGAPLDNERFMLNGAAYYTDDAGFFTVEETVIEGEEIKFDGFSFACSAKIPALSDSDAALADFGAIACTEKPRSL